MSGSRTATSRTIIVSGSGSTFSKRSTTSIASAQRRLHRKEFAKFYIDLCQLQHSHPLQAIKQNLDHNVLDVVGDRIKFDEWYPIISALSWDQTLHVVAFRLRHRAKTALESADTELKARNTTKQPVLTTKFVLYWMVEAINQCFSQSPALTVLELESLPLKGEFIASLAQGVVKARALQHLSLCKSSIGDEGAEYLCLALKDLTTLATLDLSYCDLTEMGAVAIAKLITHQKLSRYSEAWKQTLRYRDPDVEAMPGLRRLTLNHNPEIGDQGIQLLAEELRDDLWLRALDVQNTGLTEDGGSQLAQLVRNNPNFVIVDARGNPDMPEDVLSEIMSLLAINNADKNESEYKWLSKEVDVGAKKSAGRPIKMRPWGVPSGMRLAAGVPPPSFHTTDNVKASFQRSQSSLSQRDVPTWRDHAKLQQCDTLQRQLDELTGVLNFEIKQKSAILRENQELKQKLDMCEQEKRALVVEFEKKNVINDETLAILEETLSRFAFFNQDYMDNEGDVTEILGDLRGILSKSKSGEKEVNVFEKRQQKKRGRKLYEDTEKVIWEEDEAVSTGRSRKKDEQTNSMQKAQEIFARLLTKERKGKKMSRSRNNRRENVDKSSDEGSS